MKEFEAFLKEGILLANVNQMKTKNLDVGINFLFQN